MSKRTPDGAFDPNKTTQSRFLPHKPAALRLRLTYPFTPQELAMLARRRAAMSKTRITAHGDRRVSIRFLNQEGEAVAMDIWAPEPKKPGGYSYVLCNNGRQLCERLSSRGVTLIYHDGTNLIDLVRREYRAMRAAEKRRERASA